MNASELLARAFQDDPLFCWAEPDAKRRLRTAERICAGMIQASERDGGHIFEPGIGSVHWRSQSSANLDLWDILTTGIWSVALVAPPSVWRRLSAHDSVAMQHVQSFLAPEVGYLCQLGVEPTLAGKGHGSRLLQGALQRMAARWRTCILRTEQPKNVAFYQRNGFTPVDEFVVPQSGLRTWIFSRDLQAISGPKAEL